MKVVLLAGGFGTRISEESHLKPKPMIEIGGRPILWHIMKIYSSFGFNEFVICCGYKAYSIKEYFADYYLHNSDITFDFSNGNTMQVHSNTAEPWKVTLIDTGLHTMTGGRVKRIAPYVNGETFFLSYGDGVADIDIASELSFHRKHGKIVTMTTVSVGQRFGVMNIEDDDSVSAFREKSDSDGNMINGGFMICEPGIMNYLDNDQTVLERAPFEQLAREGQLMAYRHNGFWQCMDTQRDKQKLEELWENNAAPWRIWE